MKVALIVGLLYWLLLAGGAAVIDAHMPPDWASNVETRVRAASR